MKSKLRIGIIGGGNMGAAIISGIRTRFAVRVSEKDKSRCHFLKRKFKLPATDLKAAIEDSDVIILAVKPQNFEEVLGEIKGFVTRRHLIISIAAGMTTQYIEKCLGNVRVIRTMPNLPAQIGMAMTAVAKGKFASKKDVLIANKIFQSIGLTVVVKENQIDAITAVSGSGPAYVFLFIESFVDAAKKLGFSDKDANNLVLQTLHGSLGLLEASNDGAAVLRQKVTSKGGTTEAALKVFEEGKYALVFEQALCAAKNRAKELSK